MRATALKTNPKGLNRLSALAKPAHSRALRLQSLLIALVMASFCLSAGPGASLAAPEKIKGKFIGDVVVQWLNDGRRMKLREPFGYLAKNGQSWNVPKNTVVDGATIPSIFWSFTGGPFSGRYRAASVIHDYYCDTRMRPWKEVHNIFYEAMLTAGVEKSRAWLLYNAVLNFGPTWAPPKIDPSCERADGTIDFENCSMNSLTASPVEYPTYGTDDVKAFLKSMEGKVSADDLESVAKSLPK